MCYCSMASEKGTPAPQHAWPPQYVQGCRPRGGPQSLHSEDTPLLSDHTSEHHRLRVLRARREMCESNAQKTAGPMQRTPERSLKVLLSMQYDESGIRVTGTTTALAAQEKDSRNCRPAETRQAKQGMPRLGPQERGAVGWLQVAQRK